MDKGFINGSSLRILRYDIQEDWAEVVKKFFGKNKFQKINWHDTEDLEKVIDKFLNQKPVKKFFFNQVREDSWYEKIPLFRGEKIYFRHSILKDEIEKMPLFQDSFVNIFAKKVEAYKEKKITVKKMIVENDDSQAEARLGAGEIEEKIAAYEKGFPAKIEAYFIEQYFAGNPKKLNLVTSELQTNDFLERVISIRVKEKYKISDYQFFNFPIENLGNAKSSLEEYTSHIKYLKEEYEKIREGALPLFRVNIAIATASFGIPLTLDWGVESFLSYALLGVGILILCISIYLVRSVLVNPYFSNIIGEPPFSLTPETLIVDVYKKDEEPILDEYKNRIQIMRNYHLPICLKTNSDAQVVSRASYILTVGTLLFAGFIFFIYMFLNLYFSNSEREGSPIDPDGPSSPINQPINP